MKDKRAQLEHVEFQKSVWSCNCQSEGGFQKNKKDFVGDTG